MSNEVRYGSESLTGLKEQRESILKLNPDLVYGVYDLLDFSSEEVKLMLVENVLTCYPNQFDNLKGLSESPDITILDLNSLRKGEINVLKGSIVKINKPVLLSNGVIDYIEVKSVNHETGEEIIRKHIITTLRDGGAADKLQRTTTAGRNVGVDLHREAVLEHIEEAPFLGTNLDGEYCLATISLNEDDLDVLKKSIKTFLSKKSNLSRENPDELLMIKAFERNFPGIKYEDLVVILLDIVNNNRFMIYFTDEGDIEGLGDDIKKISMVGIKADVVSTGNFFVYFDKANNTMEYRKILKLTGFQEGFKQLSKRPSRLFLESQNQNPKSFRLNNASTLGNMVPTIEYVSKKVRGTLDSKKV